MSLYTILAVAGIGCLGFIVWCLHVPMPRGFSKPMTLRIILGIIKVYTTYYAILDKLGIRGIIQSYRMAMAAAIKNMKVPRTDGLLEMEDTEFDGVPVRLYRPVGGDTAPAGRPGLVYYHGGGWVLCKPKNFEVFLVKLAKTLNLVIASVDYREAPEFPFPVPFEDCVTATKYFLTHTEQYGVNPDRIAIGGDSAGGNLAAAVALKLRDDKFEPRPRRMVLIYPALQAFDFQTPSMQQNRAGPYLPREMMCWFWSLYVCGSDKYTTIFLDNQHTSLLSKKILAKHDLNHDKLGKEFLYDPYRRRHMQDGKVEVVRELKDTLMNPYFSPLMAEDLSGLPDAYVFTAHCDILRDDGLHFVRKLREAGVKVEHSNMRTAFHGIISFIGVFKEGRDFFSGLTNDLTNHL